MKPLAIFILLFIFSCKSKKPEETLVNIEPSKVEAIKKDRAFELGTRLLESCNTSRFKPFSKIEATDKVIQNATPKNISTVCQKINFRNGKFLGLKLITVLQNKIENQYIFTFAIDYEKKINKRQLMVTVDDDNRVSAISTKEVKQKPL